MKALISYVSKPKPSKRLRTVAENVAEHKCVVLRAQVIELEKRLVQAARDYEKELEWVRRSKLDEGLVKVKRYAARIQLLQRQLQYGKGDKEALYATNRVDEQRVAIIEGLKHKVSNLTEANERLKSQLDIEKKRLHEAIAEVVAKSKEPLRESEGSE